MIPITSSYRGIYRTSIKLAAVLMVALTMMLSIMPASQAAIDVYDFETEQQEAQYRGLIAEFRCPKCQNQNLAGSDAPIAQDLKQKTYDMVKDGRTDAEIRDYMQERYGDFISYKPPVRPSTWVLWFFPPVLLIVVLGGWFWRTQRRHRHSEHSVAPVGRTALSDDEQAALDRLLASRTATGEASESAEPVESTEAAKTTHKPSSPDHSKGTSS